MAGLSVVNLPDATGKLTVTGTYNANGATTVTINTGLSNIEYFGAMPATSSHSGYATFSGGVVTLNVTTSETGTWMAIGN